MATIIRSRDFGQRKDAGSASMSVSASVLAAALVLSACHSDEPNGAAGSAGSGGASGGGAGTAGVGGAGGLDTGGSSAGTDASGGTAGTGGSAGSATGGSAGAAGSSAGSAGSAGAVDAATGSDAAKSDGGVSCAGGTYAICEDFESTEVGAIPSGWTKHGGQAVVASDEAAHGTHALKISPMVSGERRIYASASKVKDAHWGRVFYKVQSPAPVACVPSDPNPVLHATFVAFQGVGPTVGAAEYRVVDTVENKQGMHQYIYNVQPSGAEFATGGLYKWKFDGQWKCVEWHLDSTNQSFHMYVDGVEDTGVAINNGAGKYTGSEMPSSFSEIKIGINNYQKACEPYLTAWIDDLVVDTNRIGCQ